MFLKLLLVVTVTRAEYPSNAEWNTIFADMYPTHSIGPHSTECFATIVDAFAPTRGNNMAGAVTIFCHESQYLYSKPFCSLPFWHSWTHAARVGEACHPGPSDTNIRIGITNPTSIVSKAGTYKQIQQKFGLHIIAAAETAATSQGQSTFAKLIKPTKVLWCPPVQTHRDRSDGESSLKGKAAGTALITSLPARKAVGTIPEDWSASCRILHSVVYCDRTPIQLVTVYGIPNGQRGSAQFNADLILEALKAANQLDLPTIILGDFNSDPMALSCATELEAQGFKDLKMLHQEKYNRTMDPTCRNLTHPDNALLCPKIQRHLTSIQVINDQWFDTHKVVTFEITFPVCQDPFLVFKMPRTFANLPLDPDHLRNAYAQVTQKRGHPTDLPEWGLTIESAVDKALRTTQAQVEGIPLEATRGLHRAYRGRCQPDKPKVASGSPPVGTPRSGEFNPEIEIHSFATHKKVKQVRRLDSVLRGLKRIQAGHPEPPSLIQEWRSALRSTGFKGNFPKWALSHPEIGPLPWNLPSIDLVHTIIQIARHETKIALQKDHAIWLKKLSYKRHVDETSGGYHHAFQRLKDVSRDEVEVIVHNETAQAMPVPQEDCLILYADNCQRFNAAYKLEINNIPATILAVDNYYLQVKPHANQDWPDEVTITQRQEICQPDKIFQALNDFWSPFWTQEPIAYPEELQTLLSHMPHCDITPCPPDLELWIQAIHSLKARSARGVDKISARELQLLPPAAINDLMWIMHSSQQGFPAWLMWCRTFPIPKNPGDVSPAQIRPISVLAQTYRLWSKIQSKHAMRQIANRLPPGITGFVPGKGPYDACYEQQWIMEKYKNLGTHISGFSIDLLKCFNTIDYEAAAQALLFLGLPLALVKQWKNSLQALTRSWILKNQVSVPKTISRGCPEGDPLSVLIMIAISTGWITAVQAQTATHLTAYADNWGWLSTNPRTHSDVLKVTQKYTAAFTMHVDEQ